MKYIKKSIIVVFLASILISCAPQAAAIKSTPTQLEPTITPVPSTATARSTALPTETPPPTDIPSATPASCAVPLNPIDSATIPAQGPFDFTWTPFEGAASYVVSIGPTDWYPTTFPVIGTTLTRYMETFPSSSSYQWSITALDSAGQEICRTGPYTFATSVDQYATPSFADEEVAETNASQGSGTATDPQSNNSGSVLPAEYAKILSIINEPNCYILVTVEVRHKRAIGPAVVQIRTGTSENTLESGFNLSPISVGNYPEPSIYQGESLYNQLADHKNGETLYFSVFFWDNSETQGLIYDTFYAGDIVPHTLTTCSD